MQRIGVSQDDSVYQPINILDLLHQRHLAYREYQAEQENQRVTARNVKRKLTRMCYIHLINLECKED